MANHIITLTIPDAEVTKAMQGFLAIYPNTELDAEGVAKYTSSEWVKEQVRRLFVRDVYRGLQRLANEAAAVAPDDALAS
jgi:hypothetical protein